MTDIIHAIIIGAAVLSVLVLLYYLRKLAGAAHMKMDTHIKHAKTDSYLKQLDDIILSNVVYTNQTFVDPMRKSESFSQLDKNEAFEFCRERVLQTISRENTALSPYIDDMDEWINSRIEYHIRMQKPVNK